MPFQALTLIVTGSINALVGAVEKKVPDIVMEQVIREVDRAIDKVRTELGQVNNPLRA